MNAVQGLVAIMLLVSASSAEAAEYALRLGLGTDPIESSSPYVPKGDATPMSVGAVAALDIQRHHSLVGFAPFAEYYRWSGESRAYLGLNVLLTGDITKSGIYGGLGGAVARWRSWETTYYSPTIDFVLGGRRTVSSSARLFGEGKLMINTKRDNTWYTGSPFLNEVLLILGFAVSL